MNTLDLPAGSYHFSPEGLRLISKCPLCAEQYQPFQASIVEEKAEAQLVHIQCRRCESSIVALLVNGQLGLTSVGLITDLTSSDVERFKDASPITEADIFQAFEEFNGNTSQLSEQLK
jgi:hypothetical protein